MNATAHILSAQQSSYGYGGTASSITVPHRPPQPGILVLSPSLQVLHMNQRASQVIESIKAMEHETADGQLEHETSQFPQALQRVCTTLFDLIQKRFDSNAWELLETQVHMRTSAHHVHIRGFGILNPHAPGRFRIVFLFEEMGKGYGEIFGEATDLSPVSRFMRRIGAGFSRHLSRIKVA